jgi:hypothetical protein
MDDTLVLKDASMELDLYLVKDNVHAGTLLMGYVPRDRMLIQADLRRGMAPASVGRQHQEERRAAQAEGRSGCADPRADSELRGCAEDDSIEADGADELNLQVSSLRHVLKSSIRNQQSAIS